MFNHGKMVRDFTYVDDIANGVVRVLDRPPPPTPAFNADSPIRRRSNVPYRVFNIGNNDPVPLMAFIEAIESALGKHATKEFLPLQDGDVPATSADVGAGGLDRLPPGHAGARRRRPLRPVVPRLLQGLSKKRKPMTTIAVIGLDSVGLPLAVEFGKKYRTLGFDPSAEKVEAYGRHVDPTGEVSSADLKAARSRPAAPTRRSSARPTSSSSPCPRRWDDAHQPDFTPLVKSSESVGKHIKKGAIVVYESTVYPGATEEVCIPGSRSSRA